jgi:lysophospholipase L1-like esterase
MTHVVLLGDSIFDNAVYVPGEPDVTRQLQDKLPQGWRATLRAVDGAVAGSVAAQLQRVPPDATHLVVSVGGNDALRHVGVLEDRSNSIGDALHRLAGIAEGFERDYGAMLAPALRLKRPTALCTIYDPRFPDPRMQRLAVAALTFFNDAILRLAFTHGLPLLDLRLICDRDEDYANPIEPSAKGGDKIASAIVRLLKDHDFARSRSEVFAKS